MSDTMRSDAKGVTGVTGESTIHDLGYRRYEGTRVGAAGAWRALFRQGFRAMFGLGRPAKAKAVAAFVCAASTLPMLGQVSAASLSQGMMKITVGGFVAPNIILFALFVAAQAPEVLSRDQQHRVLPLILTRDVTRFSYASARFCAILAALLLVALCPLMLYFLGEIGISADPAKQFSETGWKFFPVLAQAALTSAAIGGLGAALASWTPRRAFATAAIIGVFLVTTAAGQIVQEMSGDARRVRIDAALIAREEARSDAERAESLKADSIRTAAFRRRAPSGVEAGPQTAADSTRAAARKARRLLPDSIVMLVEDSVMSRESGRERSMRRIGEIMSSPIAFETQAMLFFGHTTRRMERLTPIPLWQYALYHVGVGLFGALLLGVRIWRVHT
ncbi:MAG TPA: hypothetical protein VE869_12530 [Gemmatimonas sp.]|nr:hypothetical protein [Gemmatimonas sp.]